MSFEDATKHAGIPNVRLFRQTPHARLYIATPQDFFAVVAPHATNLDAKATINLYTQDVHSNTNDGSWMVDGENVSVESRPKFFKEINAALRDNDERRLAKWKPLVRLLIQGLSELRQESFFNLYRKIDHDIATYELNETYRYDEFLSTSTKLIGSGATSENTVVVKGASGVEIYAYSAFPSEAEILILPGLQVTTYDRHDTGQGLLICQKAKSRCWRMVQFLMLMICCGGLLYAAATMFKLSPVVISVADRDLFQAATLQDYCSSMELPNRTTFAAIDLATKQFLKSPKSC